MTLSSRNTSSRSAVDRVVSRTVACCAFLSAAIVVCIVAFLLLEALPAIYTVGLFRFFRDRGWHPLSDQYNLVPMIAATVLSTAGAMLIAGPLGVASAVFTCFYATPVASACYRRLVELLAGIPSVVFGLWGLVVVVPWLSRLGGSGQSLLAATLVLALMVLPTVALTSQAALQAAPRELLAAGAALGLSRWSIARRLALPVAWRGIRVGLLLALTRAMGETMAVLMLSGNVVALPTSATQPVRTLTANIALEMGYASHEHRSTLFVTGLVLMSVVALVVLLAARLGDATDA